MLIITKKYQKIRFVQSAQLWGQKERNRMQLRSIYLLGAVLLFGLLPFVQGHATTIFYGIEG